VITTLPTTFHADSRESITIEREEIPKEVPKNSLDKCSLNRESKECCIEWSTNTDSWWSSHPDWLSSTDNSTHTCFRRMSPDQAVFVRQLHSLQHQCTKQGVYSVAISSGYAAALMAVSRSLYAAYNQHQLPMTYRRGHENAQWNFAPREESHWAFCSSRDLDCYFLPLSDCNNTEAAKAPRGNKPSTSNAKQEFRWLRQYAFRPKHIVRKKLVEYLKEHEVDLKSMDSCTAIHVRRGDIAFGKGRRYAAVDEYLEAGNVSKSDTVLLLTDDVSAVEEVEKHWKSDYKWIYLDRPRFRGSTGGFEGFLPSKDPALEVLAIMAEVEMTSRCNKVIHGKSGFVAILLEAIENAGHSYKDVHLQNQLNKQDQPKMDPKDRAAKYLKDIEERLEKKKNTTKHILSV